MSVTDAPHCADGARVVVIDPARTRTARAAGEWFPLRPGTDAALALAMMHVIQGVFDITGAGIQVVGTDIVNESGSAVEFVGARWNMLVAGVAIWRIYDGLLLALVVIHGFNGLRHVVNDYAHAPLVNRALNWAIVFGAVALIVVGAWALLAGVDETAYQIAEDIVLH